MSYQPQDGIYITAHCMKCITDYQLVISLSLEYPEAIAAGTWSTALEEGLQHEAFQPLALPAIRVGGPAMLDFKVKYNGHLLMHVAGTGYSGDRALSLEVYRVYEDVIADLCPGNLDPAKVQIQVVAVKHSSCIAYSCNVDGRLYTLGPNGGVYAAGMPRMHMEIRRVSRRSSLAMGMNADSVSLQLMDKAAFMDMDLRIMTCPPEWLKMSNAMGAATGDLLGKARDAKLRVEGPDQLLQYRELLVIHSGWLARVKPKPDQIHLPDERIRINEYLTLPEDQLMNMHIVMNRSVVRMGHCIVDGDAIATFDHNGPEVNVDRQMLRSHGVAKACEVPPKALPVAVAPGWMRQAAEQARYENTPRALGPYLLPAPNGKAPPPPPPGHRAVAITDLTTPGGVTIHFIGEHDPLPEQGREVVVMNPVVKAPPRLPVKAPPKAQPTMDMRPTMATVGKHKQAFSERLGYDADMVLNAYKAAQQMNAAMARGEKMSEADLFKIALDSIGGTKAAVQAFEPAAEGWTPGTASSSSAGTVAGAHPDALEAAQLRATQAAAEIEADARVAENAQVDEVRRASFNPMPTVHEYHADEGYQQPREW